MNKKILIVIILLSMGVMAAILAPHISTGKVTASPGLSNCSPISRNKYPFRHWTWSGIFPFEGGFIPDPHFGCSEFVSMPRSVQQLLGDSTAKFQIMNVNRAFEDSTTEILLIISAQKHIYEFKLPVSTTETAILGEPMYPEARLFPINGKIAVLTQFMQTKQIYLISLPLNPRDSIRYFRWNQIEAKEVIDRLKLLHDDLDLRQHFCGPPSKPFMAFYEKFSGSCSPVQNNTNDVHFEEFW
jgi:hypothetical protein